jgi:class 3 adenylate cyclase/tetratricopeptide (TPR) repeat protein
MRCSKCGSDNPAGKKFCGDCGAPLENRCVECGADNPPGKRFCGDCGTPVGPRNATAQSPSPSLGTADIAISAEATAPADGERKTVTALFADIKGSMELIEDLDPEEARAIVDPALKLMIDAVRRYDGYVVQSTGDGIFALFGAPVAHEDHPQRALYSALRMHEAMRRYGDRLRSEKGLHLQLRIGVNIGEVVVRTIQTGTEHTEYSPIGHSTSLAARLQTLATPGSTVVGGNMRALVEGYFQLKGLGPTRIRGVSEPVELFEVIGLGPLRTRLQRAAGRGLTKFVGREREMEVLRHSAAVAREGRGQIVATMAEPGVGKSRLFYEFEATSASGWMVLEALSISHGKASAYLPVTDLLRNYFEISAVDDERKRREKVTGKITVLDRSLEDTLPYLFNLLGLFGGDDAVAQTDVNIQKRRMLEAIKRFLLRESVNQPLMLIFEDLHWMDGESEALVNLLADSIATSRILLLVNYRPEYRHQWGSKTYYTQLRLDPLGNESTEEMLSALLSMPLARSVAGEGKRGDEPRAGEGADLLALKQLIAEKTEGNPLFMEEIVLSLFEDGTLGRNGEVKLARPLASLRIPPTMQGILASRIDRLPADEKDLLQTVAVIGTEFNLGLACAVSGKPGDDLNRMFNDLQLAEFIYEQPTTGDVQYTFKHALTHDVAYQSLLAERRKLLHQRTGQAIETLYADRLDDHLTELAHHFDTGGNVAKAVEYLGRSGARTAKQGAHSEAIGNFSRALELLRRLSGGAARDRQELDLQMALSWSSRVARGPRAPEHEHTLVRARELAEQLGDNARLMAVLVALSHQRLFSNDFELARELAERVMAMAQEAEAPAMLAGAHNALGNVRFTAGQFPAAREHFECAVELFGTGPSDNYTAYFAQHAPNILLSILIILGYPSTALTRADELLAAARRSTDPSAIAIQLFSYGMFHLVLRDTRMVAERADELRAIAVEHEMRVNLNAATFFWGWAIAAAGRVEEGIAEMGRSMSDPIVIGAASSQMLSALAETCGKHGRVIEGIDWVAKGLAAADETGVRTAEAELQRVKGELLVIKDTGDVAEAECCLRTAIDVARWQSARLFELRATISLARLLKQQRKTDEARRMLTEIHNWFTEGFDTADLKSAKTLLDELSR